MRFEENIAELINQNNELQAMNYLLDSLNKKKLRQSGLIEKNVDRLYEGYLKIKDTMKAIKLTMKAKFDYSEDFAEFLINESKLERKFIENLEECSKGSVEYWTIWLYDYWQEFSDSLNKKWANINKSTDEKLGAVISNSNPFYCPIENEGCEPR